MFSISILGIYWNRGKSIFDTHNMKKGYILQTIIRDLNIRILFDKNNVINKINRWIHSNFLKIEKQWYSFPVKINVLMRSALLFDEWSDMRPCWSYRTTVSSQMLCRPGLRGHPVYCIQLSSSYRALILQHRTRPICEILLYRSP